MKIILKPLKLPFLHQFRTYLIIIFRKHDPKLISIELPHAMKTSAKHLNIVF
ncbi:hypothetical protein CCAND95_100045 [Capnocytophaga canis]|nr:hypothetical protein CCAND95_100045 [Capnocytophaga canis]